MMSLVVYDQDVLGVAQVSEEIPDVSLIAPGISFIDSLRSLKLFQIYGQFCRHAAIAKNFDSI